MENVKNATEVIQGINATHESGETYLTGLTVGEGIEVEPQGKCASQLINPAISKGLIIF